MKSFVLFLLLVGLIAPLSNVVHAQGKSEIGRKYLILYVGVTHEETLSSLPRGAKFIGNYKDFSKVAVAKEYRKIRFTPVKAGIGTLSIHDGKGNKAFEYRLDIRKTNLTRVVREIRALLNEVEGITVKIVNNKVVVDGKVIHPEDLNRIVGVVKQFGNQASSLVEVSPIAQQKIAQVIEREINNPDISVRSRNGKFILTGQVQSSYEKDKAELIARTYIPPLVSTAAEGAEVIQRSKNNRDPLINLITIRSRPPAPSKKMIQIVLHYVELNKDYSRSSRFQWTPGLTDETNVSFTQDSRQPSGVVAQITGVISNLLPKLNWARAHGFARILKSTNIMAEDGNTGTVSENTQVPFTTVNAQGAVVTNFANVTLSARISPKIENPRQDLVGLQMQFQTADLVGTAGDAPIIASNSLQTKVSVRSGQSAAVGGLIKSSRTMDYNKLPESVQNPLFSFYASKAFQKNQTQFVIFVTPVIKSSASSGSNKIKEKFRLNN